VASAAQTVVGAATEIDNCSSNMANDAYTGLHGPAHLLEHCGGLLLVWHILMNVDVR